MPGTFVDNIRGGRVLNMFQLTDIGSNDQYLVLLILHKSRRRNKAVYRNRPPANFSQMIIDGLQIRDMFDTQTRLL
ncbi:hypothetical protein D9M69_615770 [compost metagenome]